MSNKLKNKVIYLMFAMIYLHFYFVGFTAGIKHDNGIIDSYENIIYYIVFFLFYYVIYILYKNKLLYVSISTKIIIFTIFLIIYFFIEQLIIHLTIFNIGDSDGWIRNNIYENINYQFKWYEVLFWNFIFSLHYPIYIFIFFKPFVNYLDKSIRKIKEKTIKSNIE